MTKGTIGVGLVGTGYMGKCHALAWTGVHAVFGDGARPRLVHLAEVEESLARQRADEFGFARASGDWRRLVADPEVDVVSITTPNAFHAEMAIAALAAGKHVWCEKPMATALADARAMRDAARAAGCVAVLGYNYVQSPLVRLACRLIRDGRIGRVTEVRVEMDEDFMADPEAPFSWRSEKAAGLGALDDFAVHPLSLIHTLAGPVQSVLADMAKPYPDRPDGSCRRAVETFDIARVLMRLEGGIPASILVSRAAWGRKGRIALQIHGAAGMIVFDQERFNELQLFERAVDGTGGFRTILAGPEHEPYARFCPAPGHGLGFNDLKIIEAHELLLAIAGRPSLAIDFDRGLAIEIAVDAMARSARSRQWTDVAAAD